MSFGAWLRENREAHGWTQRVLAAQTDGAITASQVHRLETGQRMPGLSTLRGLAHAFGVSFRVDQSGKLHANGTELMVDG
jgi:transcriptional regulator with XRE-family HTH domain